MLTENNVLTFTNAHTNFVNGLIAEQLKRLQAHGDIDTRYDFILPILYRLSTAYFPRFGGPTSNAKRSKITCGAGPNARRSPSLWN